ncbi:hypothetical protein FIBSPDRAFT_876066 [Athelia psychrophila]|uniref:Uncharacterized protein n=1 Tax=Athelia psychrophila TaxID=1759441 RepID=A0A167X6C4_9AGAM|nr:hypothetical protein FIBSPDRAFT_876066 [Fibularhizoctonia sp. CBS 109695]
MKSRLAHALPTPCILSAHRTRFLQLAPIGYMVHTIPTAPTPTIAPTIGVSTVAGTLSCCETWPSHPRGEHQRDGRGGEGGVNDVQRVLQG